MDQQRLVGCRMVRGQMVVDDLGWCSMVGGPMEWRTLEFRHLGGRTLVRCTLVRQRLELSGPPLHQLSNVRDESRGGGR